MGSSKCFDYITNPWDCTGNGVMACGKDEILITMCMKNI